MVAFPLLRRIGEVWREIRRAPRYKYVLLCCLAMTTFVLFTSSYVSQEIRIPIALGRAFLQGKLALPTDHPGLGSLLDTAVYQGKLYWPGGPLMGMVGIPFAFFGDLFSVRALLFIANVGILLLLYKITKAAGCQDVTDRLLYSFGFFAATNVSGIAIYKGTMTFFQQMITVFFALLALFWQLKGRHPVLVGSAVAAAFMGRFTLIGIVPLFPLVVWFGGDTIRSRLRTIGWYSIPVLLGLITCLLYNYFRFGNMLENGYTFQTITAVFAYDQQAYGLFNIRYIPANLYYFLLKTPELVLNSNGNHAVFPFLTRSLWGMSILITSPFLVLYFFRSSGLSWARWLRVCSILVLIPMLLYYGIGWCQYGYRYAIDIYPMLFILTIFGAGKQVNPRIAGAMACGLISTWLFLFVATKYG